jgi:hypothetical protein
MGQDENKTPLDTVMEEWYRTTGEMEAYFTERDRILGPDFGALLNAARRKEKLTGAKSEAGVREEKVAKILYEMEGVKAPPGATEDDRNAHKRKCLDLAREWQVVGSELVKSVLTPQEVDHCIAVTNDREYRRTGDSLMAKAHRLKDEVLKPYPSTRVRLLTKDRDLMSLYARLRKSFDLFCLSADDQEAYDQTMAILAEIPAAIAKAESPPQSP